MCETASYVPGFDERVAASEPQLREMVEDYTKVTELSHHALLYGLPEMARHADLKILADLPVYFCDPHSPWQRGANENTNGLLRQYFPKGTDLSAHSSGDLEAVAAALNDRPRKTLGWKTPAEALDEVLLKAESPAGAQAQRRLHSRR